MNSSVSISPTHSRLTSVAASLALLLSTTSLRSAVLSSVPMQGGMVMPMIAYHAEEGRLHVMMDPTIPQLTPLLVSNPSDSFSTGDPWFDALDPSRQGQSFSRRYGFVMDNMTDPLPAGLAIWLRRVSSSPGLEFHRYAGSVPKAWEPIFGTSGTTNALQWNGMMFHPGVTAPPGTNSLEAVFEAFVMDTRSGTPVPDSGTGPFTLEWTNVSDGRPAISLAMKLVVGWPAEASGWAIESTESLTSPAWSPVSEVPTLVNGQSVLLLDPSDRSRFFRMKRVP